MANNLEGRVWQRDLKRIQSHSLPHHGVEIPQFLQGVMDGDMVGIFRLGRYAFGAVAAVQFVHVAETDLFNALFLLQRLAQLVHAPEQAAQDKEIVAAVTGPDLYFLGGLEHGQRIPPDLRHGLPCGVVHRGQLADDMLLHPCILPGGGTVEITVYTVIRSAAFVHQPDADEINAEGRIDLFIQFSVEKIARQGGPLAFTHVRSPCMFLP